MDRADGDGWRSIGAHAIRAEPPDIFFLRIEGDMTGPEMERVLEEYDRFVAVHGRGFWLSDGSKMGDLSVEARKLAARVRPAAGLAAAVVFGTSFRQRLMATLLVKTAALFRSPAEVIPVVFVQTEQEARAWIDGQRRRLSKRPGGAARSA